MFMRKNKCANPYITIMLFTMAAIGVVSLVDKGRAMCQKKMECIREKLPAMFQSEEAG